MGKFVIIISLHFNFGRCYLTKEKITQLFNEGGPEAYESTEILFFKEEVSIKFNLVEIFFLLSKAPVGASITLVVVFTSQFLRQSVGHFRQFSPSS